MAYWTTETRPMFNAEYDRQMRMIRNMTLTEWLTLADTLGLRRNDREGAAYRLAFRALQQDGDLCRVCHQPSAICAAKTALAKAAWHLAD